MPDFDAKRALHVYGTLWPKEVTSPIPVTTTLCIIEIKDNNYIINSS